jgi:hypothetical protein
LRPEPIEWDDARRWPTLDSAALYGLAGEIVRAVAPQTEADPAALLFTLLTVAGNMAGKHTRAHVHDDEHPARLFVVILGRTSSGAKGTSLAALRPILRAADEAYFANRVLGGFGSGEAIVAELQAQEGEPLDPRLLILETEFAALLAVNGREGSKSSTTIRQAWDGAKLEARRSKDKSVAFIHHVSCLGHVTPDELLARMTENDCSNGFANRFLFIASKRSQLLPYGGDLPGEAVGKFAERLRRAIDRAQVDRTITFSASARGGWEKFYCSLPDREGVVGKLTARARAQTLRLAVAYAILDEAGEIKPAHVSAAEACWRYSVATVEHVFGTLRGDTVQDRLLSALRDAHPDGLTGAQQDAIFSKNLRAGRLLVARQALERAGMILTKTRAGGDLGGRPTIVSYAIPPTQSTEQHGKTIAGEVNPALSVDSVAETAERTVEADDYLSAPAGLWETEL